MSSDLGPDGLPKRPMFYKKDEDPSWKETLLVVLIIIALGFLAYVTMWADKHISL